MGVIQTLTRDVVADANMIRDLQSQQEELLRQQNTVANQIDTFQAQVFKSTPFGALHCKYTRVLTLRMREENSHKLLPLKVLRHKVICHKLIRGLVMAV